MSDLLNTVMEDPEIKKEIISRAKEAIKNITLTKKDIGRIKTAIVNMIIECCDEDNDAYYEIQDLMMKEVKKFIVDKFSDTIDIKE